jgi:hypothetical protein
VAGSFAYDGDPSGENRYSESRRADQDTARKNWGSNTGSTIFLSSKTSRPAMGPKGYWGFFPGVDWKGVMLKAYLQLVSTLRVNGFIPLLPLHAVVRNYFTFILTLRVT